MRGAAHIWALAAAGTLACMPNPRSMREKRAEFDRAPLVGSVILGAVPECKMVGAVFDGRLELAGYDETPEHPLRGDRVELTFYWRALHTVPEDYWVFVHGDADGGTARRIFGDHLPAAGCYPTSVWAEGEVVVDRFFIAIPRDYGPEHLALYTGLYLGDRRLPLTHPGKRPADSENRSRALELEF